MSSSHPRTLKATIKVPARVVRAVSHACRKSKSVSSRLLSRLSFLAADYFYFVIVCLTASIIFWAISTPTRSISYADSLFLVVSAMTSTGLRTINLSQTTIPQQVVLFLLMIFGSRVWVSICIVYGRMRRFHKRFDALLQEARGRRDTSRSPTRRPPRSLLARTVLGRIRSSNKSGRNRSNGNNEDGTPYLSWEPTVESSFTLTSEQRGELGGIEYRALKQLFILLLVYVLLWQFLGCIALASWIQNNLPPEQASHYGIVHHWWLGIFSGVSAFNNVGLSLVDASMIPFQRSYFVIITTGLLIQAGYVGFPVLLKITLWSLSKLVKRGTKAYENLRFTLDHPQRVYIYLFRSRRTWWCLFSLLILNATNWVGFILFSLGNDSDVESIPTGPRVLVALFQAFCVRFGGFHVVKISSLHIGLQVLYAATMFALAYPIVRMDKRRTNVYEETSIAHHRVDPEGEGDSTLKYLGQVARFQLTRRGIWALILAVFAITAIEADHFRQDPVQYSTFKIMFETASAYCGSGVSVGWPDKDYSFSGGWHDASKVILCVVMLRGRHRDLPDAIDPAVLLPSEARGATSSNRRE
ncbi:cation transport protein-domain-containing protein [Lasiosphaeria ovina]|uniref:Cation transport protein-domain-containing protein n=1 Tax=Lasiosphaeria ovina TaxID=92902 RepID=A0AAE0MZU9_9PEZI|nr:cation transport protein-domain-containing protein [Lasiosphaeria ovina]